MDELHELIDNYQLIQPAVSLVAGGIVGTVTRLFQNYRRRGQDEQAGWFPGGAVGSGVAFSMSVDSNAGMYVVNIGAALVGDYLAATLVDRLSDKR